MGDLNNYYTVVIAYKICQRSTMNLPTVSIFVEQATNIYTNYRYFKVIDTYLVCKQVYLYNWIEQFQYSHTLLACPWLSYVLSSTASEG